MQVDIPEYMSPSASNLGVSGGAFTKCKVQLFRGTFPCAWVLKTPDPHSNFNCTSPVHLLYADAPHRFHAFFLPKKYPKEELSTDRLHGIPSASEARFGGLRSERLNKCELQFSWKLRQKEKK